MKLEKREKTSTIVIEEYYYLAEDGKEFHSQSECRKYESELHKAKAKEMFKTEKEVYTLIQPSVYVEDINGFYYLKTEEDMQVLWKYFELQQGQNDRYHETYNYQGEGWYVKKTSETLSPNGSFDDYYYDIVKVDFKAWKEWLAQFDWIKELAE